jgi:FAD/FMN-containing dehydrogenase
LLPYATGTSFLTLLTDHRKTRTAFTAGNYARLTAVKRAWDPDNVFHLGHNIPPGEATS